MDTAMLQHMRYEFPRCSNMNQDFQNTQQLWKDSADERKIVSTESYGTNVIPQLHNQSYHYYNYQHPNSYNGGGSYPDSPCNSSNSGFENTAMYAAEIDCTNVIPNFQNQSHYYCYSQNSNLYNGDGLYSENPCNISPGQQSFRDTSYNSASDNNMDSSSSYQNQRGCHNWVDQNSKNQYFNFQTPIIDNPVGNSQMYRDPSMPNSDTYPFVSNFNNPHSTGDEQLTTSDSSSKYLGDEWLAEQYRKVKEGNRRLALLQDEELDNPPPGVTADEIKIRRFEETARGREVVFLQDGETESDSESDSGYSSKDDKSD